MSSVLILTPQDKDNVSSGLGRYMVFPCEFGVDSHPPKISESVNPFQGCAIEAVGVRKLLTFICYSHDFAFGLVKIKFP